MSNKARRWCLVREILSQLPAGMATELVYLMYKTVIDSTPFFEGLPRDVQTKLCLSMKPYPALAGDLVRSRHADRHITIAAHTSGVACTRVANQQALSVVSDHVGGRGWA
eukprot:COSAG04_NODE_13150_length_618_cov_1.052023_2_plen_110_part_00